MSQKPFYKKDILSNIITNLGWNDDRLANATKELTNVLDGKGINKSTANRVINCKGKAELRTITFVLKAIAKEQGHNDVDQIKKEIEFKVTTEREIKIFDKDSVSIVTGIGSIILQTFIVFIDFSQNSLLLEILLFIIFAFTITLLIKQKIKYWNILIITSTAFFLVLSYLNLSGAFRKSFSIQDIQVVESECLWENEFVEEKEGEKIVGFIEKTKDVWIRWRTYPTLHGKDTYYDNTPMDKNLSIVYNILRKNIVNKIEAADKNTYLINECNNNYSVIIDSSYRIVFRKLIESFRGHNKFIECIKSIWPSKEEIDFYRTADTTSWNALLYFMKDFFRDKYPIFAIEIKNESNGPIKLEKASIAMKDLLIDMFPKNYAGGYSLKRIADYELTLTNLQNEKYIKFLEDSITANPHGYKTTYREELDDSFLDLDPKLIIEKESTVLIYLSIKGGYRWPCKLQFSFYDSNGNKQESKWYFFHNTSHPLINLYEYEEQP